MKLYTIYEIGHKDETGRVPLPRKGTPNEIALCQTDPSDPPLRGTGMGWREISREEVNRLMGWSQ